MSTISLTELRQQLFKLADQVVDTGVPLVIERRGIRLRLVREAAQADWADSRHSRWCKVRRWRRTSHRPFGASRRCRKSRKRPTLTKPSVPHASAAVEMLMLDTHIAVAMHQGKTAGLSRKALAAIDRESLSISPAELLELELLHEIGRLKLGAAVIARYLADELAIPCAPERFVDIAFRALPLAYMRDSFDCLIVAHAEMLKAPLITLDQNLRQHYALALS